MLRTGPKLIAILRVKGLGSQRTTLQPQFQGPGLPTGTPFPLCRSCPGRGEGSLLTKALATASWSSSPQVPWDGCICNKGDACCSPLAAADLRSALWDGCCWDCQSRKAWAGCINPGASVRHWCPLNITRNWTRGLVWLCSPLTMLLWTVMFLFKPPSVKWAH